jgi:hypothetical protein
MKKWQIIIFMLIFRLLKSKYLGYFAMTNYTIETIQFPVCKQRRVEAEFSGGNVSSSFGVSLACLIGKSYGFASLVIVPEVSGPESFPQMRFGIC